jgi:carbamoyltransferase
MSVVLGISETHCASAAISKDGKIVACASEERFTRKKNQDGFPENAVKWVRSQVEEPIDKVILSFKNFYWYPHLEFSDTMSHGRGFYRNAMGYLSYKSSKLEPLVNVPQKIMFPLFRNKWNGSHMKLVEEKLGIKRDKIVSVLHQDTHIASAMYANNFDGDFLILTLDGSGDGVCATVSKVVDGKLTKLADTPNRDSLGILWRYVTEEMGMKPVEHEYKIMGLAPYAHPEHVEKTYKVMKKLIEVENLKFKSIMDRRGYKYFIRNDLRYHRFDNIAGALQRLTDELLCEWVRNAVKETGIHNVALAGGVFMNVKSNMEIMYMPEVENLFIFPSSSDESTAIGACYYGHEMLGEAGKIVPIKDLYLGPEFSDEQIKAAIPKNFNCEEVPDIEKMAAEMLADGKIVSRMSGRMEFGARALGNRTIMANASNQSVVKVLNDKIKNRDFWMPFAPTVLHERQNDYIMNPKKIDAPYMIICFKTKDLAKDHLIAGLHPADMTCRPQLLREDWNPKYYKIIKEYSKLTGMGGILNTSLNIHGEPVVCSPQDGIHTLECSGLEYMIMGKYMVSK